MRPEKGRKVEAWLHVSLTAKKGWQKRQNTPSIYWMSYMWRPPSALPTPGVGRDVTHLTEVRRFFVPSSVVRSIHGDGVSHYISPARTAIEKVRYERGHTWKTSAMILGHPPLVYSADLQYRVQRTNNISLCITPLCEDFISVLTLAEPFFIRFSSSSRARHLAIIKQAAHSFQLQHFVFWPTPEKTEIQKVEA